MSKLGSKMGTTTSTIGVFDSGFGGLTVLRALVARLPQARFAFLGDTARLPYGSKSRRTIARYAVQSAQFLVREQGAEFLVIACNTASALALDAIQDAVPVPVLGVIEPGADAEDEIAFENEPESELAKAAAPSPPHAPPEYHDGEYDDPVPGV